MICSFLSRYNKVPLHLLAEHRERAERCLLGLLASLSSASTLLGFLRAVSTPMAERSSGDDDVYVDWPTNGNSVSDFSFSYFHRTPKNSEQEIESKLLKFNIILLESRLGYNKNGIWDLQNKIVILMPFSCAGPKCFGCLRPRQFSEELLETFYVNKGGSTSFM